MPPKKRQEEKSEIEQELNTLRAAVAQLTVLSKSNVIADPMQYSVYKKRHGAAQFSLLPPTCYCRECRKKFSSKSQHVDCSGKVEQKQGAVLVEATNGSAANRYEWDKKISFAMSAEDLGRILNAFARGEKVRLLHDPNITQVGKEGQVIKSIEFTPNKDGGYLMILAQTDQGFTGDDRCHRQQVPLSSDEVRMLRILFSSVIPRLFAWV
jgi:hypothetical protein